MRSYLDIPYVENATAEQMMDMFLPEGNEFDTMIWFHGGGLEYGSYKTSRKLLESYAANNVGLVSAGYRKYPHARFPDFLEDAAEAVAFAIRRLRELGVKGRIFIQGESAGAYITMMLCMDHRYLTV